MLRCFATWMIVALSGSASAQTVLFQDGFENGFAQWTAHGLWNLELSSQPCAAPAAPFPEGTAAAWYGDPTTCNYSTTQVTYDTLELNTWVNLPSNVASVTLYFESRVHTEYCHGNFDVHSVIVSAQNGPDAGFTEVLCAGGGTPNWFALPWHERRVDLSAYRGGQVRVAFQFYARDPFHNNTLGWLVDDVRIVAEPGSPYCPSANAVSMCPCDSHYGWGGGCPNSLMHSATLMSGGQASVASDSLTFTVAHMPQGTVATLFQGTNMVSTLQIFGDGLLCVTGSLIRLGTGASPSGSLVWPAPSTQSLSIAGGVLPAGGDRYYQVIYRDAAPLHCTSATFNLTSAQKVSWSP